MVERKPEHVEKRGATSEPGKPQPEASEVESARLLENKARDALRAEGFSDERIRELADGYVALDLGEDLHTFIAWARERGPHGGP
jgi:hypothetical protein